MYAKRLSDDDGLDKVLNQLIQSLSKDNDEFRAFLAAWTALEIFVSSVFKQTYEQQWFDKLANATPPSAKAYFDSLKEVMNSRHKLTDKFVVLASLLNPEAADDDLMLFKKLKRRRDLTFHGSDDLASSYPTDSIQELLTKYLRLHLMHE